MVALVLDYDQLRTVVGATGNFEWGSRRFNWETYFNYGKNDSNGDNTANRLVKAIKTVSKDAGYLAYLRQVFGLEPASKP